ncbi:hypothetical protein JTB14_028537 [Gonioctena quinquepunctata]|nr:hypothetical protein JTB14_028537 [Gonioctena quinquepunctata]
MDESEVTIKDVYMLMKEVNTNFGQRIEKVEEATNNLSTVIYAEVENIEAEVQNLEEENEQLKKRSSKIEKKSIINNLVFNDIPEATNDRPENLAEKIRELENEATTQDLSTVLTTYLKKQEILRNGHKLKGSKIFVSEELLEKELKERQILLEGLKEARNNSQKATIRGNKLIVEDKIHSAAELQSILIIVTEKKSFRSYQQDRFRVNHPPPPRKNLK